MHSLSKFNFQLAAERLEKKVMAMLGECAENKWAEYFAAIITPLSLDIKQDHDKLTVIIIPYQAAPTPEKSDFLASQYPGAFISWWSRADLQLTPPVTDVAVEL